MNALVNELTLWQRPTFSPTLIQLDGVPVRKSSAWARKLPLTIESAQPSAAAVIDPWSARGARPPATRWLFSDVRKSDSALKSRVGPCAEATGTASSVVATRRRVTVMVSLRSRFEHMREGHSGWVLALRSSAPNGVALAKHLD